MRRFNPEKELRKIQYGGRNRVLYGIIVFLLIISIGSTYALYQVRYSKRIIYTKVAPFSSKDIQLAVKVEGKEGSLDYFPVKEDGYEYIGTECDNSDEGYTTISWDEGSWRLTTTTSGPNKCIVTFKQDTLLKYCEMNGNLNECMEKHGEYNFIVYDNTKDNNLRYIGQNPNNYVWFNCNDYNSEMNEENCEKWRIIGLMNNMTIVDEKGNKTPNQSLVKIIRAESIGNMAWDNKPNGTGTSEDNTGSNNWSDSRLMMLLNEGYEENTLMGSYTGSLYWNRQNGKCAASTSDNDTWEYVSNGKSIECNLGSIGLKNEETKNMIEQVTWNLGGTNTSSATAQQVYGYERGTGHYNSARKTEWIGKIGLIYPSDYAYATGGGITEDRKACLAYSLGNWNSSPYKEDCIENDWLYMSGTTQWTLMPWSSSPAQVYYIRYDTALWATNTSYGFVVRPSLYLTSSVKIAGGDGSSKHPYILVP